MFAKKIQDKNASRENAAVVRQIGAAFDAARAFVYEEFDNFPDGIKAFSGDDFVESLEPFGLPLGFQPSTPLGQSVSLVVSKNGRDMFSVLVLHGGKTNELRRAEILTRVGFWGAVIDDDGAVVGATGGWRADDVPNGLILSPDDILVRVPEDDEFSELVSRSSKKPGKNVFHTDLEMDGRDVSAVGTLSANAGRAKNAAANDFVLSGTESDRKNRNDIGTVRAGSVRFSASDGNPLTITRSDLKTGLFSAGSIANYGDLPALTAGRLAVRDFNMTAGRSGFAGPAHWDIKTNAFLTNIILSVEKLSIASFLDTSRGQDVFLSPDDSNQLEYTAGSGVRATTVKAAHIVLRDQISSDLLAGGSGDALLEIWPAGTSVLQDVLVSGINNDSLNIPISAADNSGKLETCRSIIARFGGRYNQASLSDYVICRFVMLNRIEHRIEIKKCLLGGGTNCN
jgi:hypothetical protein